MIFEKYFFSISLSIALSARARASCGSLRPLRSWKRCSAHSSVVATSSSLMSVSKSRRSTSSSAAERVGKGGGDGRAPGPRPTFFRGGSAPAGARKKAVAFSTTDFLAEIPVGSPPEPCPAGTAPTDFPSPPAMLGAGGFDGAGSSLTAATPRAIAAMFFAPG